MQRRSLLQALQASVWTGLSGATGALSALLPSHAQERLTQNPFRLGVASGSPSHKGLVLWTRLLSDANAAPLEGPIGVRWELAEDESFGRIVQKGEVLAIPELAHSVHVEVQGLAPDRWYHYRFICADALSPVGRTRTCPDPQAPVQRLRLAYASCQRYEHGHFGAYRHMQKEDLDLVLFLGDYIYESAASADALRVAPGGRVSTLEGYRQRYAVYRSEAALQAMHATCPWLMTWDDHEVGNDYFGSDTAPDFVARKAAAYQAFYEHMPVRASSLTRLLEGLRWGAEMRIYGGWRYGQLAHILLLDDRQYRDAQVCNPNGKKGSNTFTEASCATLNDPQRTLLGRAQEQWLDQQFKHQGQNAGPNSWTILGQQSLLGPRGRHTPQGWRIWNDAWDGYPAARRRLIDGLQGHRSPNPVVFGGDVHENWVGHVKADYRDPNSPAVGVEFCGTSIASRSGTADQTASFLADNPHFIFGESRRRGYGVAEFTPKGLTTTLRVVDDVTKPDARIETLAQFAVAAGQSRVEKI